MFLMLSCQKKNFKKRSTAEIIKTEKLVIYEQGLDMDVYC